MIQHKQKKTRAERDDAPLTMRELASLRPVRPVFPDLAEWSRKRKRAAKGEAHKVAVSIRLSPDVIQFYKNKGEPDGKLESTKPCWQSSRLQSKLQRLTDIGLQTVAEVAALERRPSLEGEIAAEMLLEVTPFEDLRLGLEPVYAAVREASPPGWLRAPGVRSISWAVASGPAGL